MSAWAPAILAFAACACGGAASALAVNVRSLQLLRRARREAALGSVADGGLPERQSGNWAMRYCEGLTRRLFAGSTEALAPSVRRKRAAETRAGRQFVEAAVLAGCAKAVTPSGFCEARVRLALAGALAGSLFGALISLPLAFLLGSALAAFGWSAPARALRAARQQRGISAERHLSEMLEVVSLGLRSGLTFDRSFELYGLHFDNEFACACARTHRSWSLGLVTREEALRELAGSYDCDQLARVMDSVVRSLRFGSSLTSFLEEAACQSRATYRAALEERVAKAPVKMMLPTGTLILPAMLLLVMGPVLLEVAGGF